MAVRNSSISTKLIAVTCAILLVPSSSRPSVATELAQPQANAPNEVAPKIPNDQLDSLVAPIALYPDPLLAQVLVASTYPLELIQLQQFLDKHKDLKDKALTDAVMKEDWDASIQAMAVLPEVVKRLATDIKWTTDLGNAFLAQQSDVMDAVQRMRVKAKDTGNLKSTEQQKVETKVVENKSVVVIEPANPQVVYVPSYNPVVVYGAPVYPYPPIYYPPPGYYAASMAISFGVGMAVGAAWGGGWGWNSGWGGNNNIVINNNNNFVNNSNRQNINANRQNFNNAGNRTGGNTWQHNPQHRGGAPYSNQATANRFSGTAQGASIDARQGSARQNQAPAAARQQGAVQPNQSQAATRQQLGNSGGASSGAGNISPSRASTGAANVGANRASGTGGGGDRIGNRSVPTNAGATSGGSAFGGASGGMGGGAARASSSRGMSSMGGARGGGRRR